MNNSTQADSRASVLFLGDSNSSRSQVAEALLRHLAGPGVRVASAGLEQGRLDERAVKVMEQAGVSIHGQISRNVHQLTTTLFDIVVCLSPSARDYCRDLGPDSFDPRGRLLPGKTILAGLPVELFWDLPDPALAASGDSLEPFIQLRTNLEDRVRALLRDGYLAAIHEERLRTQRLFDSLSDGVIIHDEHRRVYVFNRAAERMTGVSRQDVIGRDCHQVFHPAGICAERCPFKQGRPLQIAHLEQQVSFNHHVRGKRNLQVSLSTVERTGGSRHVVASFRDVTEVRNLRRRLATEVEFHGIIGASESMREIFSTIRQVAPTRYSVLVLGDTGTGKELVARAIHEESPRAAGPFVPINCGALPEHILESELFGHVRGAFTGAVRDKRGRFELARGGTIFLDEVGELTPAFQVKLLRVLQERTFERVGGERSIKADVRVISATNKNIRAMVARGDFRQDLFYRLCVMPISLPPLRDRAGDIPLLVNRVLEDIASESSTGMVQISAAALETLERYPWPGNVRELINALQYACIRCNGEQLLPIHLPPEVLSGQTFQEQSESFKPGGGAAAGGRMAGARRSKLNADAVRGALEQTGGNKVKAAAVLGVGRATLYRFLARNPL